MHGRDPPLPGGGDQRAFRAGRPGDPDPPGRPPLGAVPAIEPFVPDAAAGDLDSLDWSAAYETDRASDTLQQRITEWATAFATDDRRQLLEITGDSRNGIEYVGLGAWQVVGEPVVGGLFTRSDGAAGTHVEIGLAASTTPRSPRGCRSTCWSRTPTSRSPRSWPGVRGGALTLAPYESVTPIPEQEGGTATSTTTATTSAVPAT